MMNKVEEKIRSKLFALKEEDYAAFNAKLLPNIPAERVLGVRAPVIKALAKELSAEEKSLYIGALPHYYNEENLLHSYIIAQIKNEDELFCAVEEFLPYIDNWMVNDLLSPKLFKKRPKRLLESIEKWIKSQKTYTVRFGLDMLMSNYLDEGYFDGMLELAASVKSEEYYVNMMQAWLFATALAKRYDDALPYIERNDKLSLWVRKKSIQKAIESYRVTDEHKNVLRNLRAKLNG